MFSDWLQGPYVYQLYVSYGFSAYDIGLLFVGGFGSSLIFGTFIGSLADKYGRRFTCLVYCACYIIACLTKTIPEFWILMIGRILSGVSTSLLFCSFESWMVCEHHKMGFDDALLGDTFSLATFGNGVVAVLAGLVANVVASWFGFVAPFLFAIIPLSICGYMIRTTWTENYGNTDSRVFEGLLAGFDIVRRDSKVALLGLGQSCFEGAMYVFVFLWTPALKTYEETIAETDGKVLDETTSQYLGLIFAVFMVCVMVGSSIYRIVTDTMGRHAYKAVPVGIHGAALLSMVATTFYFSDKNIVYASFLVFETCVGVFYPAYGVIKSEEIPENVRSSVMSIFRIPLNILVVLILVVKDIQPRVVFGFCIFVHAVGLICYYRFYQNVTHTQYSRLEMKETP